MRATAGGRTESHPGWLSAPFARESLQKMGDMEGIKKEISASK